MVDSQIVVMTKLNTAVTEHTAEKTALETAKDTADDLVESTASLWDDAVQAKADAETARAEVCADGSPVDCVKGTTELLRLATEAQVAATGVYDDAIEAEAAAYVDFKPAKLAFDKNAKLITLYAAGCVFTDNNCESNANDPIKALVEAAAADTAGVTGTKDDEVAVWNAKVTAVATAWKTKTLRIAEEELAQTADDTASDNITATLTGEVTSTLAAKNTASLAQETAVTAVETVTGQKSQA